MKNKTVNETSILWTVIIAFFPVWICLFLAACSNSSENETISISKKEYQVLKGDSTALLYPKKFYIGDISYDIERGSDGHEYYLMKIAVHSSGVLRPFHYPDCVKCNKSINLPINGQ
jgi:hypothetical protein